MHFFDGSTWKYHPTITFKVDPDAKDMVIVNVMISKDKLDYQSLIVSYFKNKGDTYLTLKVFQYTSKAFIEFHSSELNNLKIYNGAQPMFLDINGDMKTDMIFTGKDA